MGMIRFLRRGDFIMDKCPICSLGTIKNVTPNPIHTWFDYICDKCGSFGISDRVLNLIRDKGTDTSNPKIASYLRARFLSTGKPISIMLDTSGNQIKQPAVTLQEIIDNFPDSISDRIDRILINLSKLSRYTGYSIRIRHDDYSLFYADSVLPDSMFFIIKILEEAGYIEITEIADDSSIVDILNLGIRMRISAKGWERLHTISTTRIHTNNAFVAMSFDPDLNAIYTEGIEKAIADCNYKPIRVDKEQHNEKICDKIILEIRRSRFVVCDFTNNKAGVYFEAGFALGLNIPVIWTCREDQIDSVHFDTRQYNHLLWRTKDDLYEKLKDRILATII